MRIIIIKNYEELSSKAFEVLKGVVKSNPYAVLGLATGTTPLGLNTSLSFHPSNDRGISRGFKRGRLNSNVADSLNLKFTNSNKFGNEIQAS